MAHSRSPPVEELDLLGESAKAKLRTAAAVEALPTQDQNAPKPTSSNGKTAAAATDAPEDPDLPYLRSISAQELDLLGDWAKAKLANDPTWLAMQETASQRTPQRQTPDIPQAVDDIFAEFDSETDSDLRDEEDVLAQFVESDDDEGKSTDGKGMDETLRQIAEEPLMRARDKTDRSSLLPSALKREDSILSAFDFNGEYVPRLSRREWQEALDVISSHVDPDLFTGKDMISKAEATIPEDRRGTVRRHLDTTTVDNLHAIMEDNKNPHLKCAIFEAYIEMCTAIDEPEVPEITVRNRLKGDGMPPPFEFEYTNEMLYTENVPDPEIGIGCSCEGPCDPASTTCLCVRRQELYFYDSGLDQGFAYKKYSVCEHRADRRDDETIRQTDIAIWECGPSCNCPPDCLNRVRLPSSQLTL